MPRIAVLMPALGITTGEMPHLRWPPKNYMPGQNLYYLYTACRNLGYDTRVVDANWSRDAVGRILDHAPDQVLITTATPTFAGTLTAIAELRERGFDGPIHVGGPHVSLNAHARDYLLPEQPGVHYHAMVGSASTFDWVPRVFPGRSPVEVMGQGTPADCRAHLARRWEEQTGRSASASRSERYLFTFFRPSSEWMADTYQGAHVRSDMRHVPIRHSVITSIGCSKTCSFCANPFVYQIGFKHPSVVRAVVREYLAQGIDRVSVHDMFFLMNPSHAKAITKVMQEEGMAFSMQTCLENLDDEILTTLRDAGLQKFLVGIENPVSYSVGKTVDLAKVRWLLDRVDRLGFEGVKLSYIVGLPGVSLADDIALIDHIVAEVQGRDHPLSDLQVNLYTPYRPEGDSTYRPFDPALTEATSDERLTIDLLDRLSFRYWGSFPVAFGRLEEFRTQLMLVDIVHDRIYSEFRDPYRALRAQYVEDVTNAYPELSDFIPAFEESQRVYREATRGAVMAASA
ncbi:MAG: radical SAM protein [Myxococcota bacterium]